MSDRQAISRVTNVWVSPWPTLEMLYPWWSGSCAGTFPSRGSNSHSCPTHGTFLLSSNTLTLIFQEATSTVVPVKQEASCTRSCSPEDPTGLTLAAAMKTTAPLRQRATSCCKSQLCPSRWKWETATFLHVVKEVLPSVSLGSSSLLIRFVHLMHQPLLSSKVQTGEKRM